MSDNQSPERRNSDVEVDFGFYDNKPLASKFKINKKFVALFVGTLSLNGLCLAWALFAYNYAADSLASYLRWSPADAHSNHAPLQFCSYFGLSLGVVYSLKLKHQDRRRTFIATNATAAACGILMQVPNLLSIALSRFGFAFCTGLLQIQSFKMVNETIPDQLKRLSWVAMLYGFALGLLLSIGICSWIASSDSVSLQKSDPPQRSSAWRAILGLPILFNGAMALSYRFLINTNSIGSSLMLGDDQEAYEMISLVYDSDEDNEEIIQQLKRKFKQPTKKTTFSYKKAVFGPKYLRATLVTSALAFVFQFSGPITLLGFSRLLFTEVSDESAASKGLVHAPRGSALILSLLCFVAILASPLLVSQLRRKTLFLLGQSVSCLCLAAIAALHNFTDSMPSSSCFLLLAASSVAYHLCIFTTFWIYTFEILNDSQYAFVISLYFKFGAMLVMMVENQVMTPGVLFVVQAVTALLGVGFILKAIKDTTHLTGRQKRQLYIPDAILNPVQKSPQGQGGSNIDIEL